VLHSQRSQMSVRYEIAMHARQREKFAQQLGVPFRWLRSSAHPQALQPGI
jgi:hypothetical protein